MEDKQIECALKQCCWSTNKYTRCKGCPYNDGSPCITNLHLDALRYIERLKSQINQVEYQFIAGFIDSIVAIIFIKKLLTF